MNGVLSEHGGAVLVDAIRAVAEAADRDPAAVLQELGRQAERLLGCDAASIHLTEPTAGGLLFRRVRLSAFGTANGAAATPLWAPEPAVVASLVAGRTAFVADFPASAAADLAERPWIRGIASGLYAPLLACGELLGVLFAAWHAPRAADPTTIAAAEALASCAAVAVRSANLLDESRRSNEHLEAVLDAAADSVAVFDARGRVLRINRALRERWLARMGRLPVSVADLRATGQPSYPDGRPVTVLAAERALAGETADEVMIYPSADGGRRIHLRASPVRGQDGTLQGAVVISRDVTEIHAAEEQRHHAERRARAEAEMLAELAAAVAAAPDPAEVLDAAVSLLPSLLGTAFCCVALPGHDGVLHHVAVRGLPDAVARRYSFRPGEGYIGRAFAEGRPQRTDDLAGDPASHHPDLDALSGERAFVAVPLIAHGRVLGVIAAGSPTPGALGPREEELLTAVARHAAVALAAAEAREALRRAADEKTAILEQMSEALLVADATGRVVLANPAAANLFGVPVDRILGLAPGEQPWATYTLDGAPLPPDQRVIARTLRGEDGAGSYRVLRPDGTERWAEASAAPLRDQSGVVTGVVFVARDVTERLRAETVSRRAETLRALGQMAGGVVHDLNQALGLVAGYGDLAQDALDEDPPDLATVREAIGVTTQAALDAGRTVAQLLAFASGREEAHAREPVDLAALLHAVARLTAPRWRGAAQAEGRPIELTVQTTGDVTVLGTGAELREALTNLVFNAVDAMPAGGRIRLTATRAGDRVHVEVADTGTGMAPEVLARAFEPFFTTKGDRGTGLGLAQVFRVVDGHGGTIAADSEPGRGTTVRVELPAVAPATAAAPPLPASAPPDRAGALRVLVVDDEAMLADAASRILAARGHTVSTATSAEEALHRLRVEEVDALVSDLSLGAGLNGFQLVAEARRLRPNLRCILTTGWGAGIDPAEARAAGVDAVVAKPYRAEHLLRALAAADPPA